MDKNDERYDPNYVPKDKYGNGRVKDHLADMERGFSKNDKTDLTPGKPMFSKRQLITREKIKSMLPKGAKHSISDTVVEVVNNIEQDIHVDQAYFEESFMSHLYLLGEFKVDMNDYVNAMKYCVLTQNMTNKDAYSIVFPEKYNTYLEYKDQGKDFGYDQKINNFDKRKIVQAVKANMQLAVSITYAPVFAKGMITLQSMAFAGMGAHGKLSGNVQMLALSKLIDVTMPKEDNKLTINVGQTDSARKATEETNERLAAIAMNQQKMLAAGMSINDVQMLNITVNEGPEDV